MKASSMYENMSIISKNYFSRIECITALTKYDSL